jgi:hypothetical protein
MLELAAEDVEKVRGDTLGSFWAPTAAARAHARSVAPTHHDHLPPDVRREAYSWGLMARSSPNLPGGVARAVVTALSRAGWLLLLPLGLANVAYWSRRLLGTGRYGRGARSIRVFGLALSLLLVTALSTVTLDVVGTQCFGPDGAACPALPDWLTWLGQFTWSERLVLLSVVPVAGLGFLSWLATGSRVRYERSVAAPVSAAPPAAPGGRGAARRTGGPLADPPVLARPGLWSRWVLARSMSNLHLAAGLALVTLTLAWSQVFGAQACLDPGTFVTDAACLGSTAAVRENPVFAGTLAAAVAVLLGALVLTATARVEVMPAEPGRSTSFASALTLGAAVAVFAVNSAAVWFAGAEAAGEAGLAGLALTPGMLLLVLLVVALAGLTWRRGRLGWLWVVAVVVLAVGLAVAARTASPAAEGAGGSGALAVAAASALLLVLLSAFPTGRRAGGPPTGEQAWAGAAPGVFLLLALGAAMVMTGLLVVVVGDWLNGAAPAPCLVLEPAEQAAEASCRAAASAGGTLVPLTIPATYAEFGVATLAALLLVVVLVVGTFVVGRARAWWHGTEEISAAAVGAPEALLGPAAEADAAVHRPAGALGVLARRRDLVSAVVLSRRIAALLHRGELVTGLVAGGVAVAAAATLFVAVDSRSAGWLLPRGVTTAGLWVMAILWVAVVVRVVAAQETTGRPIGLIWDLMCFLPRSAHPFGPPCYAERAVPEIAARMDAWLRGDDLPTPETRRTAEERRAVAERRVVLSAHSLGAVLAVAAILTEDTTGDGRAARAGRVALLTYGAQLRAYFGRMFPELLGPAVLGTAGCRRARALGRDPWRPEVAQPAAAPLPGADAPGDTLVRRLGGRRGRPPAWVSLWRRTDPLGFPLASYAPNLLDRGAEEIDPTSFVASVGAHSGYPRTSAYRRAMREVLDRLDARP